ncbi:SulP family inorganic anion transporter [Vogesella indigofera]|uniref:SulP family inorganic anion transporter n=1 Tax=Vogesella indigofera TaxID=45465 RepID=UPI00234F6BA7|nr:SulP family inorganic anion transporter [Vogesella indigofera]MDC7706782.1 SulP family inorganic anion transporter [Vogesella indigofera]
MKLNGLQGGVSTGVVSGVVSLSMAAAMAQLILGTGELQQYVPVYFVLLMVATGLGCLVALLGTRLPVVISGLDEPASAIIASLGAQFVTAGAAAGLLPSQLFTSLLALISTLSLCTGLVFLLVGQQRLGRLARFIPYPVVAGFLAGTGFLLVLFGIEMALGRPFSLHQPATWILQGEEWFLLYGAVGFGVLLWFGVRVSDHAALIPSTILLAVVIFYASMLLSGSSVADAMNARMLPTGNVKETGAWHALLQLSLTDIHWDRVVTYLPAGMAATFVAMLSMLSNVTAIEYAAKCEVDHDRELVVAGLGNVAGAVFCGVPMVYQMSDSTLACRLQAGKLPLAGILLAITASTFLLGDFLQSHFPIFVLAGLLVFFGLDLLVSWLVRASKELVRREFAIVCLIALCILIFDFLTGILFGLLLAILLFVYQISRLSPIQAMLVRKYGAEFEPVSMSGTPFNPTEQPMLLLVVLQGYLFFGSAHTLYSRLRQRMNGQLPAESLVCIDLSSISHLDSSAVQSLTRLQNWARDQDYRMRFICPHTHVHAQLQAASEGGDADIAFDVESALRLA